MCPTGGPTVGHARLYQPTSVGPHPPRSARRVDHIILVHTPFVRTTLCHPLQSLSSLGTGPLWQLVTMHHHLHRIKLQDGPDHDSNCIPTSLIVERRIFLTPPVIQCRYESETPLLDAMEGKQHAQTCSLPSFVTAQSSAVQCDIAASNSKAAGGETKDFYLPVFEHPDKKRALLPKNATLAGVQRRA